MPTLATVDESHHLGPFELRDEPCTNSLTVTSWHVLRFSKHATQFPEER